MATLLELPSAISMSHDLSEPDETGPHVGSHGLSFMLSPSSRADEQAIVATAALDVASDDTEQEVRPRKERRIKGRRRAINPLPHVESALRRQQELKTNFRTFARPLKLILQEMARRSIDEMNKNEHAHEQVQEATIVKNALQRRLDDRLMHVKEADRLQRAQLQHTRLAEAQIHTGHCEHTIQALQELALDVMEQELDSIEKELTVKHEDDQFGNDVQDQQKLLSSQDHHELPYDSHLRHKVHGKRKMDEDESRGKMAQLMQMNGLLVTQADEAELQRNTAQNMITLLHAGHQLDERAREQNVALIADPSSSVGPLAVLAHTATLHAGHTGGRPGMPPPTTPTSRYGNRHNLHGNADTVPYVVKGKRPRSDSTSKSNNGPMPTGKTEASAAHNITSMTSTYLKHERQSPPHAYRPTDTSRLRTMSMPVKPSMDMGRPADDRPRASQQYSSQALLEEVFARPQPSSEPRGPPRVPFGQDLPLVQQRNAETSEPPRVFDHLFSLLPAGPLSSAFQARPSILNDMPFARPPPASYEPMRFRTIEYDRRDQPPLPPTAQPVNHFASIGNHTMATSRPLPPPLQFSPTMQSPLVALPPPRETPSQLHPPFTFYSPAPAPPNRGSQQQQQHVGSYQSPADQAHRPSHLASLAPSQSGGPMLAPAATGQSRAQQPAFAQQMDRQEQNRRRNTEVFPRFRVYHGPNQS